MFSSLAYIYRNRSYYAFISLYFLKLFQSQKIPSYKTVALNQTGNLLHTSSSPFPHTICFYPSKILHSEKNNLIWAGKVILRGWEPRTMEPCYLGLPVTKEGCFVLLLAQCHYQLSISFSHLQIGCCQPWKKWEKWKRKWTEISRETRSYNSFCTFRIGV